VPEFDPPPSFHNPATRGCPSTGSPPGHDTNEIGRGEREAQNEGEALFDTYTSAVQAARYAYPSRELSQAEFERAMAAGAAIQSILEAYRRVLDERERPV